MSGFPHVQNPILTSTSRLFFFLPPAVAIARRSSRVPGPKANRSASMIVRRISNFDQIPDACSWPSHDASMVLRRGSRSFNPTCWVRTIGSPTVSHPLPSGCLGRQCGDGGRRIVPSAPYTVLDSAPKKRNEGDEVGCHPVVRGTGCDLKVRKPTPRAPSRSAGSEGDTPKCE